MVRQPAQDRYNRPTRHVRYESTRKKQLTLFLAFVMMASLFAPSMSTDLSFLEPVESRQDTANNTLNNTATQTIMSNLNTSNPAEVTGVMDDLNRVHLVWIENGSQPLLQYALIATNGVDTVLISNTLIGANNSTAVSSPSLVIDSNRRAHIVWAITDLEILYVLLDPSLDDRDGDAGDTANMTLVSYTVADGTGVRSDPDIAIDSYDGAHVVWVDTYDPQMLYFGTPLIYYTMLTYDSSGTFDVMINNSIITPALGFKGNPAISMGANNTVIVVWEDTRGSLIEYVGLIDSSGSMTTEWEDMCAVFYGGNLTSGDYFQGVKPLLEQASITVLETLYALSGQMSYAASHKNCEDGYISGGSGSEGPRTTSLGQNASDTTGGIRSLGAVMYNNSSLSIPTDWSYNSEMWGPGSTWACLSWRDNSGLTPGNPPTQLDHQWNPNATKLIIPVADEGPYGGSGSGATQQSQAPDDYQSISEAHDACVSAGIIPIAVAGTLSYGPNTQWGNDTHVRSHMMDLVQCAGNTTGIQERTCDGSAVNTTDAGGDMFLYPTDNMANFEGDFESGYLTNGWGVSGTSYNTWHVEAANNGNVYSQANLCDIGGTTGNPSFYSVSCNYTHPAGETVDLTVTVDNWASEFSMDIVLPDGTVASFNSSSVYNYYNGVLVSLTGAGNYTIYLNDSYGDGGTSVSADYSYVNTSSSNPPSTPISGAYSARSGDISDNDSTNLEFTGVMSNGTVSFAYNISSEANFDFLTFSIDGVQLAQWSGSQNGNFSTPVSLGQHTLKWTYVKDSSVSVGSDAAWIDDVIVPLANYSEEMQALVQSIITLTTGTGSTETFLTVLNPYSILNNPRSTWHPGDSATSIDPDTGQYVEDIGPSLDYVWQDDGSGWGTIGHFVLVNDTRLTNGHGWSSSPDVNVDDNGNIHVVWVDGRSTIPSKVGPSQLHYMQIDLDRAGVLDGEADGLDMNQVAVVSDSAVIGSDMTWGSNPRVDFDNDNSIHITWFESTPDTDGENSRIELRWTRIQAPQFDEDGQMPLGRTLEQAYGVINTRIIATSNDNLMGVFGTGLDSSSQPIVNFDWPNRDIIWTTPDCSDETSSADKWDVCMWSENVYKMAIELAPDQSDVITLQPGDSTNVEMILRGIKVPGGSDIVITEASEAPEDWFISVGFSKSYQTTTTLIEGTMNDLDLFLRAPGLQHVNEDQSFQLTVSVTSSTKTEATTSKTVLVNLVNQADWNDDDGDGVLDYEDDCQFGDSGWTSEVDTDHDSDGCRDATEDLNDDNDDYPDEYDSCPSGYMGEHVDLDGDGCDDLHEDPDTDGDGVENYLDMCPNGAQYWGAFAEDHDGDGCRDADEDDNDDNDPYPDTEDSCPEGVVWWTNTLFDHDSDGCHDLQEDDDDDNDQILDVDDLCPVGMTVWFSEPASDYDSDGCHDVAEDMDIDNDGVLDEVDQCPRGMLGWISTPLNDWDSDGCHDDFEDNDDDGDGLSDWSDDCIRSSTSPQSHIDADGDGCDDNTEDNDLDNDGIESAFDNCEDDPTSDWVSTLASDYDSDGCEDSVDFDDDGDGVFDVEDQCPTTISLNSDYDRDGCDDETEDWDDDGDGVPDTSDSCPLGLINWDSSSGSDIDGDGCMDSLEDDYVSGKILHTLRSNAFMMLIIGSAAVLMIAGMVLTTQRGRGRPGFADQTWAVDDAMQSEAPLDPPAVEKQVRDLSDLGYSPEVAQAIVENEERARRRRN